MKLLTEIPWAMRQDSLLAITGDRLRQIPATPQHVEAFVQQMQSKAMRKVPGGKLAILSIQGMIEQRGSAASYYYGGGFFTEWGGQVLDQLLGAKDVEAILLDVDSPGGTSYGVAEFADQIFDARAKKPIHAIANSMACSAAYWIASAASSLTVTPGGDVGSIGVYAVHVDYSAALEEAGIKVTIAKAGKFKAEWNPYEPLSTEAADYLQEGVDLTYTQFVKAVARNRGTTPAEVRDKFGQGRSVSADRAVSLGMADRVASLSQVLDKLGVSGSPGLARATAQEVLRLRQDARKRS